MELGIQNLAHNLESSLNDYLKLSEKVRFILEQSHSVEEGKEVLENTKSEVTIQIRNLQTFHQNFAKPIFEKEIQKEIDKQFEEQFGDEEKKENLIQYIKVKIIFEYLSSYQKVSSFAWSNIYSITKILQTYPSTKSIFEKLKYEVFKNTEQKEKDIQSFLKFLSKEFSCSIIGVSQLIPNLLMSNIFFDEELNYDYKKIISKPQIQNIQKAPEQISLKDRILNKPKQPVSIYNHTEIKGTKEWNQNDAYILYIKTSDLIEEQKKFYSSSFVTLNPTENLNINLAAALIRKNSGQGLAPKYTRMIQTLLEFIISNLFLKDFPYVTDDLNTFLYHIGPIVIYNITYEDMTRRDFGYCHYIENNRIIKFFPDNILKKHIIDYWADKFYDLRPEAVDSYINFSKGVSNVKESYKNFFDFAASTRKRGANDKSIEEYMRENVGKFFGYRRAQVFRRFVQDSVFGILPEISSTELVKKFK